MVRCDGRRQRVAKCRRGRDLLGRTDERRQPLAAGERTDPWVAMAGIEAEQPPDHASCESRLAREQHGQVTVDTVGARRDETSSFICQGSAKRVDGARKSLEQIVQPPVTANRLDSGKRRQPWLREQPGERQEVLGANARIGVVARSGVTMRVRVRFDVGDPGGDRLNLSVGGGDVGQSRRNQGGQARDRIAGVVPMRG